MDKKKEFLKRIPKIDEVLRDQRLLVFQDNTIRETVVEAAREIIQELREQILSNKSGQEYELEHDIIIDKIITRIQEKRQKNLRKVVNATGTILHTNLGRARLSTEACKNVAEVSENYSTLEYDLKRGARGTRHEHIEKVITKIIGAEAAMVVNNNAAAVLLCLSALAKNKDVIVSRGELVEIGGSFRIPEIMELGGARLVEVGTTNKTKLSDYRDALVEGQTGILLKVHTSNYKIVGFTAEVSIKELSELGREANLPVVYDMGSGLMINLQKYGIAEPNVPESLKSGIDIITFSGDKLLGGPQAGIIAGKKEYIDKLKRHQLARVVRVDKMTIAALEATFREYLDAENAKASIPILSMITITLDEMQNKAMKLAEKIKKNTEDVFDISVIKSQGQVGGGSTPNQFVQSYAVAIKGKTVSAVRIERDLRNYNIPIISRIFQECVLIDMRTVSDDEIDIINGALIQCARKYN